MHAILIPSNPIAKTPPVLHLEPECDKDYQTLEKLLKSHPSSVAGFGRHGETLKVLHLQVRIEE